MPEDAQRRPGPGACTRLRPLKRCPSFICSTLRASASFQLAPQAPHPPHSSPSPTRSALDSVTPFLKLERSSCLQHPHWHTSGQPHPSAEETPCFSSHNPLPIKQQKISCWNSMFVPKTIASQSFEQNAGACGGEPLSLFSSDSHYWPLAECHSHILRGHGPGLAEAPSSLQLTPQRH